MSSSLQLDHAIKSLGELRQYVEKLPTKFDLNEEKYSLEGFLTHIRVTAGSARATLYEPTNNHRLSTQTTGQNALLLDLQSQQRDLQQKLLDSPQLSLSFTPSTLPFNSRTCGSPLSNPESENIKLSQTHASRANSSSASSATLPRASLVDAINPRELLTHQQDFVDFLVHKSQLSQYQLQQLRSSIHSQKQIHSIPSMEALLELPKITPQVITQITELQRTNPDFGAFYDKFTSTQGQWSLNLKLWNIQGESNSMSMDDIDDHDSKDDKGFGANTMTNVELSQEYIDIQRVFVYELYQRVKREKLIEFLNNARDKLVKSIQNLEEVDAKFTEKCNLLRETVESLYHFFAKQSLPNLASVHKGMASEQELARVKDLFFPITDSETSTVSLESDSRDTEDLAHGTKRQRVGGQMGNDDLKSEIQVQLSPTLHATSITAESPIEDTDTIETSTNTDDGENTDMIDANTGTTSEKPLSTKSAQRLTAMMDNLVFFQRLIDPLSNIRDVSVQKGLYELLSDVNTHETVSNERSHHVNAIHAKGGDEGDITTSETAATDDMSLGTEADPRSTSLDSESQELQAEPHSRPTVDPILGLPLNTNLSTNQITLSFPLPPNISLLSTPLYRLASLFVQLQRLSWPTMQAHVVHTRDYLLSPTSTITSTHFDPITSIRTQRAPHISSIFMNTGDVATISTALDTYSLLITIPTLFSTSPSGYFSTTIAPSIELPTRSFANNQHSHTSVNVSELKPSSHAHSYKGLDDGLSFFTNPRPISDDPSQGDTDNSSSNSSKSDPRKTSRAKPSSHKDKTGPKKHKRLNHLDDVSSLHFLFSFVPAFSTVVLLGYTDYPHLYPSSLDRFYVPKIQHTLLTQPPPQLHQTEPILSTLESIAEVASETIPGLIQAPSDSVSTTTTTTTTTSHTSDNITLNSPSEPTLATNTALNPIEITDVPSTQNPNSQIPGSPHFSPAQITSSGPTDTNEDTEDTPEDEITLFDIYSKLYGLDLPQDHPLSTLLLTHAYPWLQTLSGLIRPGSEQYLLCNDIINPQDQNTQISTLLQKSDTSTATQRRPSDKVSKEWQSGTNEIKTEPVAASQTTRITILSLLQRLVTQSLSTYWLHRDLLSVYATAQLPTPQTTSISATPLTSTGTVATTEQSTANTPATTTITAIQTGKPQLLLQNFAPVKSHGWYLPLNNLSTQLQHFVHYVQHVSRKNHGKNAESGSNAANPSTSSIAQSAQAQLNTQQQLHYSFCIEPIFGKSTLQSIQRIVQNSLHSHKTDKSDQKGDKSDKNEKSEKNDADKVDATPVPTLNLPTPSTYTSISHAYSILLHASLQPVPRLAKEVETFINFVRQQKRMFSESPSTVSLLSTTTTTTTTNSSASTATSNTPSNPKRYVQPSKLTTKAVHAHSAATFNQVLTSLHYTNQYPQRVFNTLNIDHAQASTEFARSNTMSDNPSTTTTTATTTTTTTTATAITTTAQPNQEDENSEQTAGTHKAKLYSSSKCYELVLSLDASHRKQATSLGSSCHAGSTTNAQQWNAFSTFHLFFSFSSFPFIISSLQLPSVSIACFGTTSNASTFTHLPELEQSLFKHLFQTFAMPSGPILPHYSDSTSVQTSTVNLDENKGDRVTSEGAPYLSSNPGKMDDSRGGGGGDNDDGDDDDHDETDNQNGTQDIDDKATTTTTTSNKAQSHLSPLSIPSSATRILTNPGCFRTAPQGFVLATSSHTFSPLFAVISAFIHVYNVHIQSSAHQPHSSTRNGVDKKTKDKRIPAGPGLKPVSSFTVTSSASATSTPPGLSKISR